MNSIQMSNICSILWYVLYVTVNMVLIPSLVNPATILNTVKHRRKPSWLLLFCMVPHKHQVIPLQADVGLQPGHLRDGGCSIRNIHTFSRVSRKLPIMKRALNTIPANSATSTYIGSKMRAVSISYEHFS